MYSKGNALVAGDIVSTMALELLAESSFDTTVIVAMLRGFNQLMMETAAGWQLQTEQNFQAISDVTEAAFFTGMQLVSAQYSVVWPLRMGQILAGRLTPSSWDPCLDECGSEAGAAFQMADDYLGMFGDEQTTGKPAGHDYREGKKTLLVLRTYKNGSIDDRKFLDETLGTDVTPEQVKRAQDIMISSGAVESTNSQAQQHADKAKAVLKKITTNNAAALTRLGDLADFLANRSV
jgi:geranylgeranyl diphosphate synthase type I